MIFEDITSVAQAVHYLQTHGDVVMATSRGWRIRDLTDEDELRVVTCASDAALIHYAQIEQAIRLEAERDYAQRDAEEQEVLR